MTNPDGPRTGRVPARAERGMIATPHALASGTGLDILRRGGSAVDAAVAANAVLCVAYPHMAGIGGDCFWLITGPDGKVAALNGSGPAAQSASRDSYREQGHSESIPSRGPLSALTVPGAVDGWRVAHERHGRLDWSDLFTDAIHYAAHGLPVARSLAEWTAQDVSLLEQDTRAAALYLRDGAAPREGTRMRNADLAATLELVARHGARAGFYEGEVAERICAGLPDSPLEPSDFASYEAHWADPISTTYRGHEVYEFSPNTQGFTALQVLNMLEGYDVAAWPDPGVDFLHHAAEAVKLAFGDRDAWLTDPDHLDIPLQQLISKEYAVSRRGLIDATKAMDMASVGSGVEGAWQGDSSGAEGDTVYLCAVDDDGLVVSLIQSIYHDFGSGVIAGDTGLILQNRGSFFSLDDEHPNRLEPGKRTFHTLIPAMVLKDGAPWAAIGTMGGEGQPQTHAALVTRMVDRGYDVQQAIEAPRWLMGRTWGAVSQDLWLEGRIGDHVAKELERRGQPVKMLPDWDDNTGHAQAIRIDPAGFLEGGADPRGDGAALGW